MTALERAETYAAIFLKVGNKWPDYRPVDAKVHGEFVYLQGVQMRRVGDTWELTENGQTRVVRLKRAAS